MGAITLILLPVLVYALQQTVIPPRDPPSTTIVGNDALRQLVQAVQREAAGSPVPASAAEAFAGECADTWGKMPPLQIDDGWSYQMSRDVNLEVCRAIVRSMMDGEIADAEKEALFQELWVPMCVDMLLKAPPGRVTLPSAADPLLVRARLEIICASIDRASPGATL